MSARGGGTPVKGFGAAAAAASAASKKEPTHVAIARIQKEREDRRRSAENHKRVREEELSKIESSGMPVGDADFQRMIMMYRDSAPRSAPLGSPGEHDITVVVRKRPINKRELAARDWDSVTCINPRVVVHAPKLKVDGITKYLDNSEFEFDYTFDERTDTDSLYRYTVKPLVAYAFERRGRGTCIAYGQTGSGKTFTITGLHKLVARDVFRAASADAFAGLGLAVHVSFLEIYGARCVDLLHGRAKVSILEDAKQRVVCAGLEEEEASSPDELLDLIARGNAERATHATEVNSQSSRSHAICEITLRGLGGRVHGSISLVDLAGSERAADSRNHNQQRRIESAEINKSLLALKECIRALVMRAGSGGEGGHVHLPFRASKLTLVLRESFTSPQSRLVMIATVSPNASSADHTQNTLRYADRVKEKLVGSGAAGGAGDGASGGASGGAGYAGAGFLDTIVGGDGDDDDDNEGGLDEIDDRAAAGDDDDDGAEGGSASLGDGAAAYAGSGARARAGVAGDVSRSAHGGAAGGAGRPGPVAKGPSVLAKPRMSPVVVLSDGEGDGDGSGGTADEVEEDDDDALRGVPAPTSVPRAGRAAAAPAGRAAPPVAPVAGARPGAVSGASAAPATRSGHGSRSAAASAAPAARSTAAASRATPTAAPSRAAGARESKAGDVDDVDYDDVAGYGAARVEEHDADVDADDVDIAPDALPLPAALRQQQHGHGHAHRAPDAAALQPPQLAPPAAAGAGAGGFRKLLQRGAAAGSGSNLTGAAGASSSAAPATGSSGEEPLPASSVPIAPSAASGDAAAAAAAVAADREREREREKEIRLKDRLRERGKLFRASSVGAGGSMAAAAAAGSGSSGASSARAAISSSSSAGPGTGAGGAGAGRPPVSGGAAAMPHDDDDDRDEPLEQVLSRGVVVDKGGRAVQAPRGRASMGGPASSASSSASASSAAGAGKAGGSGARVVQSFIPLPGQGQLPGPSSAASTGAPVASSDARRSSRDRPGAAAAIPAPTAAVAPTAAPSASAAAVAKSGADADLALLHTLRRSELNSRGGSSGGSRPATAAGASDVGTAGAGTAAGKPLQILGSGPVQQAAVAPVAGAGARPRTGAGAAVASSGASVAAAAAGKAGGVGVGAAGHHGGRSAGHSTRGADGKAGDHDDDGDTDDGISDGDRHHDGDHHDDGDGEDALLALHATAAHILEEEEDLLTQHMHAVQENAAQLREESDLLSRLQGHAGFGGSGDGESDIDVGTYAGRLEAILRERVRTARSLLSRLQRFRQHLAREERLSMTLGADDMRLA